MTSAIANRRDARTILIVDDTPTNLRVAVGYLEEHGYHVVIAQDGEEGLERAKLVQPDLIMLDVMMPGIDGFETCRRLKAEPLTWDIPVVFMTALSDEDHKVTGFRAGGVDYVTKPLQIGELIARVETHLSLHAERCAVQRQLHRSEREFRALAENSPDIIARFEPDGRCSYVSPAATRLFGVPAAQIVGHFFGEMAPDDLGHAGVICDTVREICATGEGRELELAWRFGDGTHVIEARLVPERDEQDAIGSVLGIFRDVSERKAAEARIARLTDLYAALSQCNQAIVRCADENELFPLICRDAVQFGGMKMAWIGLLDPATRMVHPAASFGEGKDFLDDVKKSADADSPFGRGPVGTAIRENRPYWCQDFDRDPATAPWRDRAAVAGWRASAALPIHREGVPVGAFALYSATPGAFDDAARTLLIEMAMDISYALDRFAAERARTALQSEIAETKARMDNVLDTVDQVIWSANADGKQLMFINRAIEAISGRPAQDFLDDQTLWQRVVHPDDGRILAGMLRKLYDEDTAASEMRLQRPDGHVRWVYNHAWMIRDGNRNPLRVDGIMSDITERKHAQAELELSAKVFEQSAEGILICDAEVRILSVNRAFCEITGYSREEVIGSDPRLLRSGRHDRDFFRQMWAELNGTGRWHGEIWNRRKNGELYPEFLSISALYDAEGCRTHYIGMFSDISQRKQAEERIRHLAHFDALTALPNRALLSDRIARATIQAQRGRHSMAVMFLDLDRFKNINDSLGHRIGDEILAETAQRLTRAVRDEDTVSRLGGDEFILLLPNSDADGAAHVAQKAIEAMAAPYRAGGNELVLTLSIGIAMYPADGLNTEALVQCADVAMYKAKADGRNTFRFFTPDMHRQASRTLRLENGLRRALERQELALHFQPKVDARDGATTGCEALLRWHHPELGTVPPTDFIPIAEDSGQILAIGEWVIRSALRQIKAWQTAGLPLLPVAVNLSAAQFRQIDLIEMIERILDESGLPPACLELELTESMTMEDPASAAGIIERLHGLGLKLSIDDFGTGYSSLSHLKRFQVDKLKIDQSFVRGITTDPEDREIVAAIVGLARSLRLSTIAEGIEHEEALVLLREIGCDEFQGYYFSRPLPADSFEALLRGRRTAAGIGS